MTPRSRKPVMVVTANINSNDQRQTMPNNEVSHTNMEKDEELSNLLAEADKAGKESEKEETVTINEEEKLQELSVMKDELTDSTYGLSSEFK